MKGKHKEEQNRRVSSLGWRFSLPRAEQDPTQALVVSCYAHKSEQKYVREYVDELISLAESCDITVVETRSWFLHSPSSSTYLNEGKVVEIEEILQLFPTIGMLIIDEEITASQQRNLEKRLGVVVLDRTELILEIFASRAFTAEAGIQVELARSRYLLPRLKRMWGHLSRQKSGGKGGGFVKGEGEKQIELDKRMIRERIHKLVADLKGVEKQRKERRKSKVRCGITSFALIGYTNSGKSSLLNFLTSAEAYAEDKLFATLDPKTRRCILPNGQHVLVTDTVGFIRKLPHTLVAAFKSTLEAALYEEVLLHVIDASHPLAFEHVETTKQILSELGVENPKMITVLNKIDLLPDEKVLTKLRLLLPNTVSISARTGQGIQDLLVKMAEISTQEYPRMRLTFAFKDYGKFTELYDSGLVISHQCKDDLLVVEAYLPKELNKRYQQFISHEIM